MQIRRSLAILMGATRGLPEEPHIIRRAKARRTRRVHVATLMVISASLIASMALALPNVTTAREAHGASRNGAPPLWRALPTKRFAVLREGRTGEMWWGIYIFRGSGPTIPCIEEVHLSVRGQFGRVRACGEPAPARVGDQLYTLFSNSTVEPDGSETVNTEIGMLFGANVARITMSLTPDGAVSRVTRLLSRAQAKKARVKQVRYAVAAMAREVCLDEIQGWDAMGVSVFKDEIGEGGCLASA